MKDWIYEEAPLLKAWGVLVLLIILPWLLPGDPTVVAMKYSIFSWFLSVLIPFITMCSIRYIRGKEWREKYPPYRAREFGVWGYFWRSIVSMLFSQLVVLILCKILLGSVSTQSVAFNQICVIIVTPFIVWLLFCRARLVFAKKVIMYIQGMSISE
ncbi:MAG: hypothetical protein OEL89_04045 [Candidatus Peregrinibacteria bacterium]|nr:hypothetical protein [Candidatus Peregrinibacteria bacterium]